MKVFIGGSTKLMKEARRLATIVEAEGHHPICWMDEDVFRIGAGTWECLLRVTREVNAAIFLFGSDDVLKCESNWKQQARGNVLIEFGLFSGVLGSERVAIARHGQSDIPTDLNGVTYLDFADSRRNTSIERLSSWLADILEGDAHCSDKMQVDRKSSNMIDANAFKKLERESAGDVYIVCPRAFTDHDESAFYPVVRDNIRNGKKYTYFRSEVKFEPQFAKLRLMLMRDLGCSSEQLRDFVKVADLDPSCPLSPMVVLDAQCAKLGYIILHDALGGIRHWLKWPSHEVVRIVEFIERNSSFS